MSQPFVFCGTPMPSLRLSDILKGGAAELTRYLGEEIYANPDPDYVSRQRERMIATMRIHAARIGDRPTYLLRAPGRLNAFLEYMDLCAGDHISTTVDGDIPVAVSLRDDDLVTAVNSHPMYPPGRFSIPEEIDRFRSAPWSSDLPDDWSSRTRIRPHYGHPQGMWLNYIRSPFLRVAWEAPDVLLRGVDMTFGPSALPLRTGMSSSSTIIVLAFLALYLANGDQLPTWTVGDVCGLLGEAEWYVGTRGGANDQTTILRNEPNGLLYNRHSRSPIECTPLPPLHGVTVVIANSLWEVSPHLGAARIINLRKGWMSLADDLLGLIIRTVKEHLDSGGNTDPGRLRSVLSDMPGSSKRIRLLESPDLWSVISARYSHLGSLVEDLLGVPDEVIEELIGLLPEEITLNEAEHLLGADVDYALPEPDDGGYLVRSAAEFFHKQNRIGREIERILNEADSRLKAGEITEDQTEFDEYRRQIGSLMDGIQATLRDDLRVSNEQFERMFQVAHSGPGFLGGKLMGAGAGGYAAFLVRSEDEESFCRHLDRHYYGKADNFARYREMLDALERDSVEDTPAHKAAVDMKINLHNALKYPSDQRRAVTFSRGACIVELDRFVDTP